MATSTGASFIMPILQHAINEATAVRRICLYWIVRHPSHLDWFSTDIVSALQIAQSNGVKVCVQAYITRRLPIDNGFHVNIASLSPSVTANGLQGEKRHVNEGVAFLPDLETAKGIPMTSISLQNSAETVSSTRSASSESVQDKSTIALLPTTYGRPASLDALIRPTIEDSEGETAIIACGGAAFMASDLNRQAGLPGLACLCMACLSLGAPYTYYGIR
jgi:Ferric reductase NAD binding domain